MNLPKIVAGAGAAAALLFAGAVFAQTPPVLNVSGSFPTSVSAGAQNVTLAFMTLANPSGTTPVFVMDLPMAFSNTGLLSNCQLQDVATPGINLNTGPNLVASLSTSNMIHLDTPLQINANGSVTLGLVCDVTANTAADTRLGVAFLPSRVFAMAGGATTTSLGVGTPAGAPFSAEIAIIGGTGAPAPTPLPPATGAGGQTGPLAALLLLSFVVAGAGVARFSSVRSA